MLELRVMLEASIYSVEEHKGSEGTNFVADSTQHSTEIVFAI
jgi:hypothetical protein